MFYRIKYVNLSEEHSKLTCKCLQLQEENNGLHNTLDDFCTKLNAQEAEIKVLRRQLAEQSETIAIQREEIRMLHSRVGDRSRHGAP